MLHPFDDYLLHQTPQPIMHVASSSPNAYDRHFFNGYVADGSWFFAAAMGVYPNRGVIDAAFSVVLDGVQVSSLASGRAPLDKTNSAVGPIRVDVVEPMRTLRLRVEGPGPLEADLTFSARTPAVEEPRFTHVVDNQTLFDYTRATQWGSWQGHFSVDGRRIDVGGTSALGVRDRSWGVRPVGERTGRGAPPRHAPQFFWLWAPLNFESCATHFAVNEHADGRRWHQGGAIVPLRDDPDVDGDLVAAVEPMRRVDYVIDWEPGTRRSAMASVILEPFRAETEIIRLEPLLTFQMAGLGYTHPEWGHGIWHDELATTSFRWPVDEVDPQAPLNLHVQQLVTANWGGRKGIGVLEQLALGNHDPTGLSGLYDGSPG
jgi:hypothetical protein